MQPSFAPTQNRLLAALGDDSLASILPKLSQMTLTSRQTLYHPDTEIDTVYFPESAMISLVSNLDDGTQAEVGLVGNEGMLGTTVLSGADTSFVEAMCQMPGTVLRMRLADCRREFETNPPFRTILLRYSEALTAQVMQTAACNGRHGLEQRLARWLLMAHDRTNQPELLLTQEFMAMMLGVHRPSLSITAAALQKAGLIKYAAGRVTILDRAGLEHASCECYATVRRRFAILLGTESVT